MGTLLACVAIAERLLGWAPLLGGFLRWVLEKDLEIQISTRFSQIVPYTGGFWYYGPVSMKVTNHSHDLTYKFRFGQAQLLIRRPVIPRLRFWRQEYQGCAARVIGGEPREQLSDFSLTPLNDQDFLIEWDSVDFPQTSISVPRDAQSVLSVPMIGRIKKLERTVANLKFED